MRILKNLIPVKWVLLSCALVLVWNLFLSPPFSSHTSLVLSTAIDLLVDLAAVAALFVHYRHRALTRGQLIAGLVGAALAAAGTAWMATTAPAGSVGDVLLFMCGLAVWLVLMLWVLIRALMQSIRPRAEAESKHE